MDRNPVSSKRCTTIASGRTPFNTEPGRILSHHYGFNEKKLPDLAEVPGDVVLRKNDLALINLYPLPSPHNHAWY